MHAHPALWTSFSTTRVGCVPVNHAADLGAVATLLAVQRFCRYVPSSLDIAYDGMAENDELQCD